MLLLFAKDSKKTWTVSDAIKIENVFEISQQSSSLIQISAEISNFKPDERHFCKLLLNTSESITCREYFSRFRTCAKIIHYFALTDVVSPCGISLKELSGVVSCRCISVKPFISRKGSLGRQPGGLEKRDQLDCERRPQSVQLRWRFFPYISAVRTSLCTWRCLLVDVLWNKILELWKFCLRNLFSSSVCIFHEWRRKFTFKFEFWKQRARKFVMLSETKELPVVDSPI